MGCVALLAQRDLWYCSRLPMARWFAAAGFLVSTVMGSLLVAAPLRNKVGVDDEGELPFFLRDLFFDEI